MRLGEYQELIYVKKMEFGIYLSEKEGDEERVLLPSKQVPEGLKPGDKIKVTVKEWECQPDKEPFVFDKKNTSQVYKCHLRPVFDLA